MADAQVAQRRIAMGLAVAALIVAVVAVVASVRRGSGGDAAQTGLVDRDVVAHALLRLEEWHSVEPVGEGDKKGVRIRDAELAHALGLEPTDVITSLSGHRLARDFDMYVAISALTTNDATTAYVELAGGSLVRWRLQGDLHPLPASSGTAGSTSSSSPLFGMGSDPDDALLATIRKIDDSHYSVPRATIDSLLADPMKASRSARVVPAIKNGKPVGFKLYAIRPSSIIGKLGFQNGDTILAINGYELTSPDKALEIYTKLKSVDSLTFDIERRGSPVMETITVR
jgi:S1-C subfamily serine protease